jgi:hypothetical protein
VATVHGRATRIDPRTHDDGGFAAVARSISGEGWDAFGADAPTWTIEPDRLLAADLTVLRA